MSNPRVKRPFAGAAVDPAQRQITSFFTTTQSSSSSPSEHTETVRSPDLPAHVQSNLLSVGMRVRKSVPEGYKTKSPSAFKLWTDNRTHVPKSSPMTSRATSRELLPFCGINKVGGLDTQPEVVRDDYEEETPDLDELPELTMSQESTDSTDSAASARKRFLDDEDEITEAEKLWEQTADSHRLAPVNLVNGRIKAMPRSRLSKSNYTGQENMIIDNDFEEADFLVFGQTADMDMTK